MPEISPQQMFIRLFHRGSSFQWGRSVRLEELQRGDYFLVWDGTRSHGPYRANSTAWQENTPLEGDFRRPFDASRDWSWAVYAEQITEPVVVGHDLMAMSFAEVGAYMDRVLEV